MNEKITIEDIAVLTDFGSRVRVVNARTGKIIIDGLYSMKNSKDRRQVAKWEAYRDVPVYHMSACFWIGDMSKDFARAAIEVSIWDSYDQAARERVKEILGKKEESK